MTQIAFTPRLKIPQSRGPLGSKGDHFEPNFHDTESDQTIHKIEAGVTEKKKSKGDTFDKVVKRIPTLYVIIFFTVFTACAVLIIWNTLQVNRLTYEKSKLESKIEQTKQRIIKLKAQEMQLSAPERVREIAKGKFGMIEANGIDEFMIKKE
ncbi:MAG: cell division protein FtsL [bacterium]